ncbi:UNVERIFIED_CONTAM: TRAF3-interacting protein 1, partial [Siphonaria sp. JEL0065]
MATPAGAPVPSTAALPPALEESIKKTVDLLSRIIKKPPLNAKLLSKPPFRYLHDIFSETIRASEETGFCRNLYDENEMNSENVKDKDAKVAYLYKMIDCIGMVTNVEIKANPLKIVAGMDAEDTNAFLQLMAKVVLKKADTSAAVKRVLAGEHFKKGAAAPPQQQPPPREQPPQKEKERTEPAQQQQQRERAQSGDRLKNPAIAVTKSREQQPSKSESREGGGRSDKGRSSESLQESERGGGGRSENKENRDRSDRESRDRGEKERDRDRDRDRDDDSRPPLEPSSSSSDLEDSEKKATSLVPTPAVKRRERPTTARAPPPKVKGAEFAAVEEAPIAPSIIQEGAHNGESDSEDEGYIIIGSEEEERAKTEAKDRRDSKGSEDELHGGLMRKIMETKDKHSNKKDEDDRKEKGDREEKPKEKSVAKREIEGLRESIQTLCRSTNPLAKTMDYMQEDVDSMNKELEFWRKESKKYGLALDEASRDTYEALMPLDLKLKQIESSIEDMVDKISNQKAGIIQKRVFVAKGLSGEKYYSNENQLKKMNAASIDSDHLEYIPKRAIKSLKSVESSSVRKHVIIPTADIERDAIDSISDAEDATEYMGSSYKGDDDDYDEFVSDLEDGDNAHQHHQQQQSQSLNIDFEDEYPQSSDSESIKDLWGYRAYEPTNPCTNRLIQKRWDQDIAIMHHDKLQRAKATIDTAPPKKYSHLVTQQKRHQIKIDDATRIYHDNCNLLDRIRRQLKSSPHPTGRPTDPHPVIVVNPVVQKFGLNGPRKRILQEQMETENEVILQRLEASSPFYRGEEFNKERINTLLHLQNISRFPKKYVRQLKEAGVQFPRVPHKPIRPLTARTDEATIITKSELKDPHSFNHFKQQVIIKKPPPEQASVESSISIPPRYGTRGPLVPRVAMLPPKKVIPLESLIPPKPVKPVPLVPRCALIPQRMPVTPPEPLKKPIFTSRPTIYEEEDPPGKYSYEDEFPGDEDLIITTDSWKAKLKVSRAITRLNDEGMVEEKREETRYNFGDRSGEQAILCGVPAFGSGFQYPRVVNFSIKIYVSSIDGDSEEERAHWIKNYLLQLRQFCIKFGKEVCWKDFKFGRDSVVTDLDNYRKVCLAEMDACHKDSSFISSMIFFNNTQYGERALPTDIDAQIFKKLLRQAKHIDFRPLMAATNNTSAEDLLKKWYRLDDNYVPKRFILRRVEEVVTNIDSLDERDAAKRVWIFQNLNPLKQILRTAAVRLGRHGLLEAHIVQRFVQSDFQEELTRGVIQEARRGGWERSLLLVNTEHIPKVSGVSGTIHDDEEEEELDEEDEDGKKREQPEIQPVQETEISQDQKLLQKLIGPLFTAIPYENKIHPYANSDEPFSRATAMTPLFDNLLDRFKRLISRQMINHPRPNTLLHEITTHMKQFKAKARDHSHRGHLISKIMTYITRTEKVPVPPFLLDGDASMGKTSVVGKTLQNLVKKITEDAWTRLQAAKTPLDSSMDVVSSKQDITSEQLPPPVEKAPYEPIIVARICGLTPCSSNARLLIDSLARQIYDAYLYKYEASEELLSVQEYRKALSLATSEKPLIIVLTKIDRLPSTGPLALKISWLLDQIPPFVRIVLTAKTDQSPTSAFHVIQGKIKEMAPSMLLNAASSESRTPPSPILLSMCIEEYLMNVGTIIAPIAKSSIKRLLTADGRKLRMDQEDALRKAFTDAEMGDDRIVPIRLLKQLYKMSKKWGSSEKVADIDFPKTLSESFDMVLSDLEISHGYYLTMTLLSVLALSRDGLTTSELEDILSLDDSCLTETLKCCSTDLARVPSSKVAQLLYDISDYTIQRHDFGGELICISHDADFIKSIQMRYLSDQDIVNRMSELLFSYLADKYSDEKPFTLLNGRNFLPSRSILDMPWTYPASDLCEKIFGEPKTWNVRKLREYPRACLVADKWIEFDNILRDVHYLTGILSIQNTDRAIEDVYGFLTFDPRQYRPLRRLSVTKYQDGKLIIDTDVQETEPEPTSATPRSKVLIFVETMLNFLVWNRHIMDISPKANRQNVVFDMLYRLPESSSLKAILYRAVAAVNLKSGSWDSFDLLKKRGYGILQCLPRWRPIVSVSGQNWSKPPRIADSAGEYRTDRDVSTAPEWSKLRRKSMFSGGNQCILDGEKNAEYWDQTHIKPSMTLPHRNHTKSAASLDGKYIASGSSDGILRIFDCNTGFELGTLNMPGHIMAVEFHPTYSDNVLVSIALSSTLNKIVIWSISQCLITHEISGKPLGLGTPVVICGFLKELREKRDYHYPQCRIFGLGLNGVLSIWDMANSTIVKQFYPDSEDNKILATGAAALSPDGKSIIFGIRSLNLINVKDLTLEWTRKIQPDKSPLRNHVMNKIIFAQDSKSVFTLSNSFMQSVLDPTPNVGAVFQRFDLATKVTAMLWNLDINASHMSISMDEMCVAFGSEAGIAHIINLKTGHLMICQPLSEPVISMMFIPDPPVNSLSSDYAHKTNWSGRLKGDVICYRVGIGCFKRGIVVTGFENVKDAMIRYSITTA